MHLPEPHGGSFSRLSEDIKSGRLKIPMFQRDFVWSMNKSAQLLDSIVKGYPIGTFIFWKTKDGLGSIKNIGNLKLPETPKGDYVNFVLDGQQRITSIFAILEGLAITHNDGKEEDFKNIFIDLKADENERIIITEINDNNKENCILLKTVLDGGSNAYNKCEPKYHSKIDKYKNNINGYIYSIIQVDEVSTDVATEIFTRTNVGGKSLTLFEIMVAKTYDHTNDFDLLREYETLKEKLLDVNYETISPVTLLQTISLILTRECKRSIILSIEKEKIIKIWKKIVNALKDAIDYFRTYYRIPVSNLLPYNTLIVPFTYFFYNHEERPVGDMEKYLEDFFWRVSLSARYSSAVESKLAQDVKRIDKILNGELPEYDWSIDSTDSFIKNNGWFSVGRSYIKAILCIYIHHQPKSFDNDANVNVTNAWLKQGNSKNYHHFFPKAYLKKQKRDDRIINHILNITIVDDYLNKRKIQHHPPSKYMNEFKKNNSNLSKTMKSHLIGNLDRFGVWEDNYEEFINMRAKVLSKEIKKRIIKQNIDEKIQINLDYDYSD